MQRYLAPMDKSLAHPFKIAQAAALVLCLSGTAQAEMAVPEMHIVAMPLSAVLTWYSEQTGQTVVIPDGLSGQVVDVRLTARTEEFTAWLARDFGLDHYRIGDTLHFAPAADSLRYLLPLDGIPLTDLIAGVEALGAEAALPLAPGNQNGTAVLVSGPAGFVALVETVLSDLKADRALRSRIVVNRGGQMTVDELGSRRSIVSIQPPEPTEPSADTQTTTSEN
ncbi:MAG: hypothetical protein MUE52_07525 [Tabrizicola sp.]|jgi:hypothetical protein|nr:hypothetical protein [Tabrizicola sp.]